MHKLGYYLVNKKIYLNKLEAILAANSSLSEIQWYYNDHLLDQVTWQTEPDLTLSNLYKLRARQIREKHDYIVLMLSGGADSTNMLRSFIDNDIKIDEVVASAPLSGIQNLKINTSDRSPENTVLETVLSQIPLIKKLSQTNPEIKITINDYFEDILKLKSDSWIYESSSHWIHFSGATRHSLENVKHLRQMADRGKKIGVVYGIDKPIICRSSDGNLYNIIADSVVNIITSHFNEIIPNVESVLFYYSPDLPELMVKQCHQVCRWIYQPENRVLKNTLLWDKSKPEKFNSSSIRNSRWQRAIIPCIYPTLGNFLQNNWQAEKHGLGFTGGKQIDAWMYKLHGESHIVEMVESDLSLLSKSIDRRYFVDGDSNKGFIRFSKFWKIGHEQQFMSRNTIDINNYSLQSGV
jgi:hypothetical protein